LLSTLLSRPRPLTLDLPPSHSPDANTDFTTAVQTLWNLDSNRLTPHEDYKMDVQNSKHPCDKDDAANDPLFTHVNTQIFATRPTYHAFKQLLDNYTVDTRTREEVTEREREEVHAFLSAIMDTAPMKYCHQYCLVKDASYEERSVPRDEDDFVKILETMWFELYSRSGCGFEHVFVGEVRERECVWVCL
jgi:poly(U)-specific endoribonuclease